MPSTVSSRALGLQKGKTESALAFFDYTPLWYSNLHEMEQVREQKSACNPAIPVPRKEI